ncbi:sulfotransferase family protein [Catenuloplanes indicus]|nr:sulfotransferase [Catenuloplanes indicus]
MGCPRSGTTMLQLMLHAHPRIAIPPETRFVLSGYGLRHRFGDLRKPERRRALADWIFTAETKVADLGLDRDEVTARIVAGPPTLGSAMGAVFQAYGRRFGKPRWGDKRPSYIHNVDVVLRLFPDAQIVTITRDGRDCVASLLEMPWHRDGIHKAISAWARSVDSARRAERTLAPDSYFALRYESLVQSPDTELRRLCAFLGEDFDDAMTRPDQVASVAVPERKKWHVRTHAEVGDDRVGTWRERLEPWQIALCEDALGDRLAAQGYALSGIGTAPPAQRVRYATVAVRHRLGAVRRHASNAYHRVRPDAQLPARL